MLLRKKKKNFPSTFHLHRVFKPNKLPPSRYRSLTSLSRGHHLLIPSLKTILPVKSIRKHHPPRIDGDTPLKTLNRWIGAENSTLPSVGVIPDRPANPYVSITKGGTAIDSASRRKRNRKRKRRTTVSKNPYTLWWLVNGLRKIYPEKISLRDDEERAYNGTQSQEARYIKTDIDGQTTFAVPHLL